MIKSKIRRLHARRSNKLIFIVAGGVALILLVFFALVIIGSGGEGRGVSMSKTLRYLKNTEGLLEIKTLDAEKRVIIVFNSDSKNADNFEKVAHYAALRLAPHWPDCDVLLARNKAEQIIYEVRVRDGVVTAEGKS